ncbi:MAG TPA: hypothetical protein EYM31_01950 [Acidobacteria bacterium]|nr:hypothetical protein [Acidobacteriota bacterium]
MAGSTLLLSVIATATVIMAVVQIGVVVFAARLAKRVSRLVDVIEHEIKPTLARVDAVSSDVARVTSLASNQAERLDQITSQLIEKIDEILTVADRSVFAPLKQGAGFLFGLRAALSAFRDESTQSEPPPSSDSTSPTSE